MVQDVEGKFQIGPDSFYTRSWLPDGPTKAKLVLIHGFSDHMGQYVDFGKAMAEAGIAVLGFDQRGWGKSVTKPAERGRTGGTATVVADVAAFIASHIPKSAGDDPPLFVMGHSLGGGVVLALAADPQYEQTVVSSVRGWLLESPFLGFFPEEAPSWLKVTVGRMVGKVLPHAHLAHRIPAEYLSRDPAVVKTIKEDKLCHDLGTLEGLAATLDRTAALCEGRLPLRVPAVKAVWLGHGTVDKAVSYDAAKKWFDEYAGVVEDREFRSYEGWFHQLHSEPEKEEYFGHVVDWIMARAGTTGAAGAKVESTAAAASASAPAEAAAKKDGGVASGAEAEAEVAAAVKEETKPTGAEEEKPESKL